MQQKCQIEVKFQFLKVASKKKYLYKKEKKIIQKIKPNEQNLTPTQLYIDRSVHQHIRVTGFSFVSFDSKFEFLANLN